MWAHVYIKYIPRICFIKLLIFIQIYPHTYPFWSSGIMSALMLPHQGSTSSCPKNFLQHFFNATLLVANDLTFRGDYLETFLFFLKPWLPWDP